VLRELAASAADILQNWKSEIKTLPDRGIIALFTGPSGTAKTMTAEVLARDLHLELYRIDLTRVASKYIGETEKIVSRIFTEGAASHAILFFDEADALFEKRSEVKDSHDRYANIEATYFLQRLEEHRGLVIIGTKAPPEWPPAVLPRVAFTVELSRPGTRQSPDRS
jgi:SpoVK/Ycf46/Vps4 family AAA+-type ATPase